MRTSEWHQDVIDELSAENETLHEIIREQCKAIVELSKKLEEADKKQIRGPDTESADTSTGFR